MTPEYVLSKVKEIEEIMKDETNIYRDYDARQKENELYREIVKAIAGNTCHNLRMCCIEALKSGTITFCRYG